MQGTLQILRTLKNHQTYSRLLRSMCSGARGSDKNVGSSQSQTSSSDTVETNEGKFAQSQSGMNETNSLEGSGAGDDTKDSGDEKPKMAGFLQAYLKQEKIIKEQHSRKEENTSSNTSDETFASLLRKSEFINLGDPVGKIVLGEIINVVGDDLYIDFGWKFYTVCPKPKIQSKKFNCRIGNQVLLKINDLELTASFLGENYYISLNEAECSIVYLPTGAVQDLTAAESKIDVLDALEN